MVRPAAMTSMSPRCRAGTRSCQSWLLTTAFRPMSAASRRAMSTSAPISSPPLPCRLQGADSDTPPRSSPAARTAARPRLAGGPRAAPARRQPTGAVPLGADQLSALAVPAPGGVFGPPHPQFARRQYGGQVALGGLGQGGTGHQPDQGQHSPDLSFCKPLMQHGPALALVSVDSALSEGVASSPRRQCRGSLWQNRAKTDLARNRA